jgi:hypothetical protein
MAGVRANISLSIDATLTGAADLGTPKQRVLIEKALSFVPGTAATDEANILFADSRTLAASANEDLDLAGVLTNAFGATIAAAEVVAIFISAAEGNTNSVSVTRPASNGFAGPFLAAGDGVSVKPGEFTFFASQSGWAVTAGTGDLINVANSGAGTSVTYDIVIIARTVAA